MTGRAEQDAICFVAAESERVLHTFRGSSYSDPDLIWRPELELETRMLGVDDTVSSKSITGDARGRWGRPVVPLPEIRDRAAAGGAHAEHKSRAEQSGAERSTAEQGGAERSRAEPMAHPALSNSLALREPATAKDAGAPASTFGPYAKLRTEAADLHENATIGVARALLSRSLLPSTTRAPIIGPDLYRDLG